MPFYGSYINVSFGQSESSAISATGWQSGSTTTWTNDVITSGETDLYTVSGDPVSLVTLLHQTRYFPPYEYPLFLDRVTVILGALGMPHPQARQATLELSARGRNGDFSALMVGGLALTLTTLPGNGVRVTVEVVT